MLADDQQYRGQGAWGSGGRRGFLGVWITPVLPVDSSKKNFGMCAIL
jgi:hypothetical protein